MIYSKHYGINNVLLRFFVIDDNEVLEIMPNLVELNPRKYSFNFYHLIVTPIVVVTDEQCFIMNTEHGFSFNKGDTYHMTFDLILQLQSNMDETDFELTIKSEDQMIT